MFSITFYGAARTTTGSMHYVEANGVRILLDCGLYQGHRKEAFERNRQMPVDPAKIDFVILSHAHIDHSGNLPTLARRGFRGKVYMTPATADLADILLHDTCYLQKQDLEFVNRKRAKQGKNLFEPLYVENDVKAILKRFEPVPLYKTVDLGHGVSFSFHEAGHILGSATVELDVRSGKGGGGKPHKLLFSGDLGNRLQPLLRPPEAFRGANTILIESTYADRLHPSPDNVLGRLKSYIEDIHQQNSRLIIPCFSVGRTQEFLYFLNELVAHRQIPPTKVFVDSPLAMNATEIYSRHAECYEEGAFRRLKAGDNFLDFPGLRFIRSVDESMALNGVKEPMVIISASGMCEGGRVVHHVRNALPDPRNIILFVGYQAEATLGRRIVERKEPIRIFGEEVEFNARVQTINALSAHADRNGLLAWFDASRCKALRRAFAVHGDEPQTLEMARLLAEHGAPRAKAPVPGEKVVLNDE